MPSYSDQNLQKLQQQYDELPEKLRCLRLNTFRLKLKDERAIKYKNEGLLRRVNLVAEATTTVFRVLPPELDRLPEQNDRLLATICLHANLINLYGIVDNLAHILVLEEALCDGNGRSLRNSQIGLRKKNKFVWAVLGKEFRATLEDMEEWFDYLESYRHSLAHRLPPYIPPHFVDPVDERRYVDLAEEIYWESNKTQRKQLEAEQLSLTHFKAMMLHDISEKPPIFFHAQLIADFLTIESLINAFTLDMNKRQHA